MPYIAHVKQDDNDHWLPPHSLEDHLNDVARLTQSLLAGDSASWGELAGRWHDLGKYQFSFQKYLRDNSGYERENAHLEDPTSKHGRVTHSTAGAVHAVNVLGPGFGHFLAYIIAGHHAGLPDWSGGKGALSYRLGDDGQSEYQQSLVAEVPAAILAGHKPNLPSPASDSEACALWIRMLFSALVDADFIDTEAYMQPEQTVQRQGQLSLSQLQDRFVTYMSALQQGSDATELNTIRNEIYRTCLSAAQSSPGIFSLTVPTGGGKSLSSLGFALEHARVHGKRRIIYAIPFTSIIEQNAKVFRRALGDDADAVLEHHSNLDVPPNKENNRSRLAAENWEAPLIVTTNVQLFESLHASRSSRCRKLHNLRDAVIVLDEAQQLPRDFHAPIVRVMKQLSMHFGVTWLLCTATQPDLSTQKEAVSDRTLLDGFEQVTEICADPIKLAQQLKRVEVEMPEPDAQTSWSELAEQIAAQACVLAIVSTRRQARELFQLLPDDGHNLHLSAQMCAEHRSVVLAEINKRLEQRSKGNSRPLRVISTQLVEAGVDVDFPVVYRAMAGLDSIAQSAGRCNREGKMTELGRVVVFNPPELPPVGFLRQAQQATMGMLKSGLLHDPLSPAAFTQYFQRLNLLGERDRHGINDLLTPKLDKSTGAPMLQLRTAAEKFRLIDNSGVAVIVPYLQMREIAESPVYLWLKKLEADASQKWVYRKLQRYTITLPDSFVRQLHQAGMVREVAGQWLVEEGSYDPCYGVVPPNSLLSAEGSIC
ncbi:CRISPR-associated endonuclease Cas3'' [Ferrimonas lipolytica]|uniref:CRISPR-associated endonuclease Cas3 n=1 Tax=Ferrimonas lipolytica TaxID=2724191 RepID=A0A6H1UB20_9GAMM|nr:CRISPR-associated endonuclease Cas3'' [Ferrimonas lipolytica]QIZ75780.1 CRISPR-associated endonuclease Cas3'' [Ferrimonas lipolytica]